MFSCSAYLIYLWLKFPLWYSSKDSVRLGHRLQRYSVQLGPWVAGSFVSLPQLNTAWIALLVVLLNLGSLGCQTSNVWIMHLNSLLLCCGTALGSAFILLFFDEFCSFQSVLQVTDAAIAIFVLLLWWFLEQKVLLGWDKFLASEFLKTCTKLKYKRKQKSEEIQQVLL